MPSCMPSGGLGRISIHAPVKGATHRPWRRRPTSMNFNPRTREGCDRNIFLGNDMALAISIHAPVKGATLTVRIPNCPGIAISIHAPVKGATRLLPSLPRMLSDFNPRTREGCDGYWDPNMIVFYGISIHAPVKGATKKTPPLLSFSSHFNPRTREGCDLLGPAFLPVPDGYFNPRTREGCDTRLFYHISIIYDFNPRTREGCDVLLLACLSILEGYFNPRTREGCDAL